MFMDRYPDKALEGVVMDLFVGLSLFVEAAAMEGKEHQIERMSRNSAYILHPPF